MNDKMLLQDLLATVKLSCDLLLNGTIESSSENVRDAFNSTLFENLKIQNEIAQKMTDKGWYEKKLVEPTKIHQLEKKFAEQSFS
jgi:spore coat protein CotF